MGQVVLDFAKEPHKRLSWQGILTLALAAVVASQLLMKYRRLANEEEVWVDKVEALQISQQELSPPTPKKQPPQLLRKFTAAHEIIGQLTVPWESLLDELEASVDETVTLSSIEPDLKDHRVRISAEAKDISAALAFVNRLNNNGTIGRAYLISHELQPEGAQAAVRFSLIAEWTGNSTPSQLTTH